MASVLVFTKLVDLIWVKSPIQKVAQHMQLVQHAKGWTVQGRACALTEGTLQQNLHYSLADADSPHQTVH